MVQIHQPNKHQSVQKQNQSSCWFLGGWWMVFHRLWVCSINNMKIVIFFYFV